MSNDTSLKRTPLFHVHQELGGKMVPFAGWHMPIQFEGVIQEHLAVRSSVGLFDVSHMGEIDIKGEDAEKVLQRIVTNDISKMSDNSILYTLMCYEDGGVVDDLLVHRISATHYFLCVNASNIDKDFRWILDNARQGKAEIKNISDETVQLAVQGKFAEPLLQKICDVPLNDLKYYHFKSGKIHQIDSMICRTGYTGEDGFEIYFKAAHAEPVFRKILEVGKEFDLRPIGLGARDTLRLEMGYALYGNEIDAKTSPLEAGLGWVIKFNKEAFIGKEALLKQKEAGLPKKLTALKLLDRGVPRSHYPVKQNGRAVGEIVSGTFSPSLNVGIGIGYVAREYSEVGARLQVEIRSQAVEAEVVKLPFVPSHVKK